MASDKLSTYKKKRDFKQTQEPSGSTEVKPSNRLRLIIQKHDTTRLDHDWRERRTAHNYESLRAAQLGES